MRIFLLLVFLFLSTPIVGCSYEVQDTSKTQTKTESKPTDPYFWDFGQARQGQILMHTFELKNESDKQITILNASASCGCTVPSIKNKVLLPGESTDIEVKFNTKGYSGEVKQYVYVNTDDTDNPILKYTIKAEIIK